MVMRMTLNSSCDSTLGPLTLKLEKFATEYATLVGQEYNDPECSAVVAQTHYIHRGFRN